MSSSSKKELLRSIFRGNGGGCGCGRGSLSPSDIVNPIRKPKTSQYSRYSEKPKEQPCPSTSSSWERGDGDQTSTTTATTTTTFSPANDIPAAEHCSKMMISPSQKLNESIAIVKDSNDPYHDFRQSMLQMILEKQIFSKGDLQDLLNCFLQLNSPSHHHVIIQAFMEIWNGVISQSLSHKGS